MLRNWRGIDGSVGVQPRFVDGGVRALFSFRHHPIASDVGLDVAFHERISPENTVMNREYIAECIGEPLNHFAFVRQVHGDHVLRVTEQKSDVSMDADAGNKADAMITNEKHVPLAILVADCVPVLFYDPVVGAIGAAHSGWRGTVAHIARKVIDTMSDAYGSDPMDIRVSIGPSIRRCCYEVDEVVAEPVRREFEAPVLFRRFQKSEKYWFSMQGAIRSDLLQAGIPSSLIEDTGVCTSCRVNHLFSHRREQGRAGRQMATIVLT